MYGWPGGIAQRFAVEGWQTAEIDGRDHEAVFTALTAPHDRPYAVVAKIEKELLMSSMRQAFVKTVNDEIATDPRIAVVTAVISSNEFPQENERVVDVGIREQTMVGVASGLALAGLRPVVHSYAPFLVERPYEQIKLDIGHQDVGAVFVSIGASYDDPAWGRTHQSPGDVALFDTLPGWTVHVPGHPDEVTPLLRQALKDDNRVYMRLSLHENTQPYPVGEGFTALQAWKARRGARRRADARPRAQGRRVRERRRHGVVRGHRPAVRLGRTAQGGAGHRPRRRDGGGALP